MLTAIDGGNKKTVSERQMELKLIFFFFLRTHSVLLWIHKRGNFKKWCRKPKWFRNTI